MVVVRVCCKALETLARFFFFNDTATTEIYTLSLHDALPILFLGSGNGLLDEVGLLCKHGRLEHAARHVARQRSEEHTSELQSHLNLVCRLLLEKKKQTLSCQPLSISFASILMPLISSSLSSP